MLDALDRSGIHPLYLWVGLAFGIGVVGVLFGVLFLRGAGSLAVGACLLLGGGLNVGLALAEGVRRAPDRLGTLDWLVITVSALVSVGVALGLVVGA